jgi:hypothetical protein
LQSHLRVDSFGQWRRGRALEAGHLGKIGLKFVVKASLNAVGGGVVVDFVFEVLPHVIAASCRARGDPAFARRGLSMAITLKSIIAEKLAGTLVLRVGQGESVLTGSAAALPKETRGIVNELSHDALSYWRQSATGDLLAVSFRDAKKQEACVTMVEVDRCLDDDAPLDATHKAFLDEQYDEDDREQPKTQIKPTEIEYVHCGGVGHLGQRATRIALAKPNPEKPENLSFAVKDDSGRLVFPSDVGLIGWIKSKSSLPGQSNVARCASAMSRGGKYTLKYAGKDVLHASKGKTGDAAGCTVFWIEESASVVRLIGFGRHRTSTEYDVYWSELTGVGAARALGSRVLLGT